MEQTNIEVIIDLFPNGREKFMQNPLFRAICYHMSNGQMTMPEAVEFLLENIDSHQENFRKYVERETPKLVVTRENYDFVKQIIEKDGKEL